MFLPIGHEQTTVRRWPWVTFALMGLCLAALIATQHVAESERVYASFGLVPRDTKPFTFFTYMFVHGGWAHLLGNMLILFLAGAPLEDRWGRPLFAGFYLTAGIAAGLFYVLMTPGSAIPMVGASGAIAALMGAALVRFWTSKIQFLWFFVVPYPIRVVHGTFWAPVWLMLPLWFGSEIFMAALADHMKATTGVAYWAHVGGFAFGLGAAWAIQRWKLEERFIDAFIEAKVTVVENPLLDRAMQARMDGDPSGAWTLLRDAVAENPGDPDTVAAFWEVACDMRRADRAAPAVLHVVRDQLGSGDAQLAAQLWCEVAERAPDARAEPSLLVRLVPILVGREQLQQATLALRHTVTGQAEPLSTGMALRVIDLARERDRQTALVAARVALANPELHEAKRAKLASFVAELKEQGVEEPPPPAPAEIESKEGTDPRYAEHSLELARDFEKDPPLPSEMESQAASAARQVELDAGGGLVDAGDAEDLSEAEGADDWMETLVRSVGPGPIPAVPPEPPPVPEAAPDAEAAPDVRSTPEPPPQELPVADAADAAAEAASSALPRFSGVKALEAALVALGADAVSIARSGGARGNLPYDRIDAVAIAAVDGLVAKPVLLVDLVLNWTQMGEGPLQVVRLRSDRFDVRKLVPNAQRPTEAFRALVADLLERSGATPLPTPEAAAGRPFARYPDLDTYQREVLGVE